MKRYLLLFLVVVALLISGCGNGEEPTPTPTPTPTLLPTETPSDGVARTGDTVRVDYTGTLDDGTQFDSSAGRKPLEFTLGNGELIDGFEAAVMGMKVGETKTVRVPVDQAYGPYLEELVRVYPREQLPAGLDPKVGDQLPMTLTNGSTIYVTVTEVTETSITIDANHPLAGKDLNFEITLVEII